MFPKSTWTCIEWYRGRVLFDTSVTWLHVCWKECDGCVTSSQMHTTAWSSVVSLSVLHMLSNSLCQLLLSDSKRILRIISSSWLSQVINSVTFLGWICLVCRWWRWWTCLRPTEQPHSVALAFAITCICVSLSHWRTAVGQRIELL